MKTLIVMILTLSAWSSLANDIAKINGLKKTAEKAFAIGDYQKSIQQYAELLDSLGIEDDAARLNMAHAQFKSNLPKEALVSYQKLILSKDDEIRSIAYQQIGVLSNSPQELRNALSYFKSSLKANPNNHGARYNYELVKKKLENQQDQKQDQGGQDQNKDHNQEDQDNNQNNKDQQGDPKDDPKDDPNSSEENNDKKEDSGEQNQSSEKNEQGKDGEGKESESRQNEEEHKGEEEEQKPNQPDESGEEQSQSDEVDERGAEDQESDEQGSSTKRKLEVLNMTEEKAQMILDAMQRNEVQYIQQNRRRASQAKDASKPDW